MLTTQQQSPPIPYTVTLTGVREVSLIGGADLDYWEDRLSKEALIPVEVDGAAQIQISAAEGRFMGVRFRELSFSVLAHREDDATPAAFLVYAYNSISFFAFAERILYRTPYHSGKVSLRTRCPALVDVVSRDGRFWASMSPSEPAGQRRPSRSEEMGWEGAVYLPHRRPRWPESGEVFYAKLSGHTLVYPFDESRDQIHLAPARDGVVRTLAECGFTGREWVIREDATHGKSKTVSRPFAYSVP